ncbi:hypothetical protein C6558_38350 [Ensifer sp. NM-2]|nr:hypothetical protein C6558_38350 [Ensifer sp. NM-2]
MLKDYPTHLDRLQEALEEFATPKIRLMPFDEAIWALEGALEEFIAEAGEELQAAESAGDPAAIERAKAKGSVMFRARSGNGGMRLGLMDDLWDYFQTNRGLFE